MDLIPGTSEYKRTVKKKKRFVVSVLVASLLGMLVLSIFIFLGIPEAGPIRILIVFSLPCDIALFTVALCSLISLRVSEEAETKLQELKDKLENKIEESEKINTEINKNAGKS